MRFFFADYVPSAEGGCTPRLPDHRGFGLLAYAGQGSPWGVFKVWLVDADATCEGFTPIDDELETLIRSGMLYPPALAIARDEMSIRFQGEQPTREEFAASYADSIRRQLEIQDTSGFLLAKAVHDEVGYLRKGGYYWIVKYIPELKAVNWVSADYFVYRNPASHFDVPRFRLVPLAR